MLILALIASAIMYCVLYWIWAAAQHQPQSVMDALQLINTMLFVPQETIFRILRGLLFFTAAYIVADLFRTALRRRRSRDDDEDDKTSDGKADVFFQSHLKT